MFNKAVWTEAHIYWMHTSYKVNTWKEEKTSSEDMDLTVWAHMGCLLVPINAHSHTLVGLLSFASPSHPCSCALHILYIICLPLGTTV